MSDSGNKRASLVSNTQLTGAETDIAALTDRMRGPEGVAIKDRRYLLKTYPKCFVGSEAVTWLLENNEATSRENAVSVGNLLLAAGVFWHVTKDHEFKDEALYYRFAADDDTHEKKAAAHAKSVSWSELIPSVTTSGLLTLQSLQPDIPALHPEQKMVALKAWEELSPKDEHNVKLLNNVHPNRPNVPPEPGVTYNMVVIGGGTAGLITASATAGLGGKSALIEKHSMGGDCLNVGCVPSKALLAAAKAAASARKASEFGINVGQVTVDFAKVMERVRAKRAEISPADSVSRYEKELGVQVFLGHGKFTSPNTVEVAGHTLKFAKAVVATGCRPAMPVVKGVYPPEDQKDPIPFLTNESVFNLTEQPPSMAVIGGGTIACEMAQAFARLGTKVTMIVRSKLMSREDPEAVEIVKAAMEEDGVKILLSTSISKVEWAGDVGKSDKIVHYVENGTPGVIEVDSLLFATGRRPNVAGLNLEAAGIEYDLASGVKVNDYLQTTNSNVYAAGDVATGFQFTHVADAMARIVTRNALFFGRDKFSRLTIPWATYTEPELAHVGLFEADLDKSGTKYTISKTTLDHVDRAIVDGNNKGFVKILLAKGSDKILGATIVGPHAGDMISEITPLMAAGVGLGSLATTIHPYPTLPEAIKRNADANNRTRLTPLVKSLMRNLLSIRR